MTNKAVPLSPLATNKTRLQRIWPYAAIFLLALALRLVYLAEIIDQPVTRILLGDAESYDTWAREILAQGWLGERTFYQAPLYPYFLALIYTLGGHDLILVRLVQGVIGAASCVLLAHAGTRFFDKQTGCLAGILLALYPPALFFDLLIQKAVLGMFFMCCLLFLMAKMISPPHGEKGQKALWLLGGVVLAGFALIRENALVLVPVMVFWIIFQSGKSAWRQALTKTAFMVLGLSLVFLPVTLRNYVVGGEFVLTTSQMGPNFYIGNSKDATGFYRPLIWNRSDWKFERIDAQNLAEQAMQRKLTPNEVSDYWMSAAMRDIGEEPLRWLRLLGKKWLLTWNALEISDSESIYAHYRYSFLLTGLGMVLSFGTLCTLAFVGIFLTWREHSRLWGLYGIWLCFAASVALFFVFARYRFPMTAVMLLFAAAGLTRLWQYGKQRQLAPLAKGALLAAPFAIMVNWPMVSKATIEAPTHFNIGYELEQRDELELAREYYLASLAMNAGNPLVHNNLGLVAMKQNRPGDAIDHFQAAVAAKPDNWNARVNLGIVLAGVGRAAEAVRQYEQVVKAQPDYNPALYYNIACFHAREGRTTEGLDWLRRAIAHGYDNRELLRNDPDLDNLRHLPEFAELLERL